MHKSPCTTCTERHEACHDRCERYKEWVEPLLKKRRESDLYFRIRGSQDDPAGKAVRRMLNRKKRRGI